MPTTPAAGTSPVIVITGASSGIGAAAARTFASLGWQVHGTGRSRERLDAVAADCEGAFTGHVADFADLAQVRALAAELAEIGTIDVLANNAGGTWSRHQRTVDGHELTIQVNHLAPFLLTQLLRPQLAGARIIATSSAAQFCGRVRPDDLDWNARRYNGFRVYAASKLANLMTAAELQRRWPDVLSLSFHPGVLRTGLWRDSALIRTVLAAPASALLGTSQQGAGTLIFLATAPREALVPGAYYYRRRLGHASRQGRNLALSAELWTASTATLGI